ncbi:hypothetical protein EVAR_100384_1 [Eumeta japonica]|uniref:Uncharacterized protein n=1 Tax=Eumeta variegata TaxID=151549 RepID=A0A4C1ZWB3_EUMVA|nr:hypothetical protein EVAR_100384_1 [Eumeta japonica]
MVPPPTIHDPSNALTDGQEDDGQYRRTKIYEDPKYNGRSQKSDRVRCNRRSGNTIALFNLNPNISNSNIKHNNSISHNNISNNNISNNDISNRNINNSNISSHNINSSISHRLKLSSLVLFTPNKPAYPISSHLSSLKMRDPKVKYIINNLSFLIKRTPLNLTSNTRIRITTLS